MYTVTYFTLFISNSFANDVDYVCVCLKQESGLTIVICRDLFCSSIVIHTVIVTAETLSRNESGRFGALKSDSTPHFFRNTCTISGSLRFSQFSGC